MSNYRTNDTGRYADIFRALSNPNRLKIFARLASCCPPPGVGSPDDNMAARVGELGKELNVAPSTVSHHIRELSRAGLIKTERCGQSIRCWVDPATVKELELFFRLPAAELRTKRE